MISININSDLDTICIGRRYNAELYLPCLYPSLRPAQCLTTCPAYPEYK